MDDRSNTTGPEYSGRPATDTLAGLHRDVNTQSQLEPQKIFATRHVGPRRQDIFKMLHPLGFSSLEELTEAVIPSGIRLRQPLRLPPPESEDRVLEELEALAAQNEVRRSFIGLGYHECITPPVIQRNILENPGWYTQYTPYQAEISQGRLEALLNFQTMISDLTGMSIANASLLDEATAAAEAMSMCYHLKGGPGRQTLLVASDCYPQTIAVIKTRAKPLGLKVEVVHHQNFNLSPDVFAILLQYPSADGAIHDYLPLVNRAHEANALVIVAADLLSLALLRPPGEFGADVVVGNSQRFGVSPGFGGPHAAFFATRDVFKRQMPGRLVGVSHDSQGKPALRLALQTREQHIRREKATSNICTAQVLLAIMASMYAVYHGPEGLRRIAGQIHHLSRLLAAGLKHLGYGIGAQSFFDTIQVELKTETSASVQTRAAACGFNLRMVDENTVGISLGETARREDVIALLRIFQPAFSAVDSLEDLAAGSVPELPAVHRRQSPFLTHKVFNRYHSETEMMRYLKRLESYDLSLTRSMIPLGSCTMKLNPAASMLPVTWPRFSRLHPYAPSDQTRGYQQLFHQLTEWLAEITGLEAVSLQPNAGSQGEYSGLLVIHAYHESRAQGHRRICLIPQSAHGTNPASAVMAGFTVIPVACDVHGNVDTADLQQKAETHQANLGAIMLTYPSTHGVFEEKVVEICDIIHRHGGLVYLDGANMNAQVGLCRPGEIGADVCHLNLHKTFSIPHGGGGPGMAPIAVRGFLAPFLPGHPLSPDSGTAALGPVAAAPWGSAGILMIPWVYIRLMGTAGLRQATQIAILNANYIAHRLESYFPVLYRGNKGLVAHECILDLRGLHIVTVEDVAKRLMDYGFHAPTISWPVPNTMMVEPTESESKEELDRFCDAMIAIHAEIAEIESGQADPKNNLLKNAPHPAAQLLAEPWTRPYSRQKAAFPMPGIEGQKFWPPVGRIDNVHGDRNPVCTCPAV